jgi:hypothetical protein
VKGPQQLGFFFLGLGSFFLLRRRWADVIKLGLVGLVPAAVTVAWYYSVYTPGDESDWVRHSRLKAPDLGAWFAENARFLVQSLLDFLPGWLLLVPLASRVLRRPQSEEDDLLAVLILYSVVCLALLLFWPGARTRYAMPVILPIAAGAGIAFDRLRSEWPRLIKATSLMVAALVAYRVVLGWIVMPLMPAPFQQARINGQQVAAIVAAQPAPIYVARRATGQNIMVYVPFYIREVAFESIAAAPPPFWAFVHPEQEPQLRAARPDLDIVQRLAGSWPNEWRMLQVGKKVTN